MKIEEILKLEKTMPSIKKIDLFLASISKEDLAYFQAVGYKGIVLSSIGRINEALKILYSYVPYFTSLRDEEAIILCNALIKICLENGIQSQALKYIEMKRKHLRASEDSDYRKDLIQYYITFKDYRNLKTEIEKYLEEDFDINSRFYYLDILAKQYYKDHDYAKFGDLQPVIQEYLTKNLLFESLNDYTLMNIEIDFESGNYIKALKEAMELLEEAHLTSEQRLSATAICIQCYLKNKEYRRATILVTKYEEYLEDVSPEQQRRFVSAALELYKEQNHLISIKEYEAKLRFIDEATQNKRANQKKKPKIVIPETEELSLDDLNQEVGNIRLNYREEKEIHVSKAYESLANVFQYINTKDKNLKFREFFRLGCIELCKLFPIEEVILIAYNQNYFGYHYKMERVYNKRFSPDDLNDTIFVTAIETEKDKYLEGIGLKNIIDQKNYEEKQYMLCFPLLEDGIVLGGIAYTAKKRFIDQPFCYETLDLISQMLNVRLNNEMYIDRTEANNKKMFFIMETMSSGLKVETEKHVHSNAKACEILDVYENLFISDYEAKILASDLANYRQKKEEAILNEAKEIESVYHFKKGNKVITIRERFYPMVENGTINLLSLIDDITEEQAIKLQLESLIYENPISKLPSQAKLFIDLERNIATKKFSVCLIDINDFKLYSDIYGYSFTSQIILKMGSLLKEISKTDFNTIVYHLESDKFVFLYEGLNDKRLVVSRTLKYLEALQNELNKINRRLKLSFSAGVFRYTANQNITDTSRILSYAAEGLLDAKETRDGKNHVSLFDQKSYQKRFFESQLITHISECIDHNQMTITYKQIIDLTEMNVYGYFARLNLVNYDVDIALIDTVIRRRGLVDLLDKYLIQHTLMELKNFYIETRAYIKIFVPIHEETLCSETILSFILTQFAFFKIPKENIIFVCNATSKVDKVGKTFLKEGLYLASDRMEHLYKETITHFFYSYKEFPEAILTEMYDVCKTRRIDLIISGVDTKEDLQEQKKLGTKYIFGQLYKKNIKIQELIQMINSNKF